MESEGTAGDAVSVPAGPLRTFRLRWPRGRDEGAVPDLERSRFGALIRREEVLWYVPVEIRLGSATLHAFGIYGASPGPYEGPAPRVPDELLGSTADLLAAGAGTVGPPPGREVPMDTSGVARVGPPPLRPPADTLTGRATPPGVRPPGAVVPPDTATLPPVRPAPTTPMPDLLGRPAAGAVAELEALGVEVEVVVVDLAASPGDAFTVTRQAPGPGALVVVGERAILGIRGAFAKIVTVPDVSNRTQRDASATLRALGLTPVVVVARSPSGEAESERIIAQQPGAGARVAPGAVVTLRTFDRWVSPPEPVAPPPHTDPVPDPDQPLPDWRREQQCRAATGVPATLMQEGRLQEALALLRTMQPTCREIVDPLITEAERRLNPTPPVAPPLTPPPVILPPPDPVTPDPAPFRQANPWILAERCPRSITLVDGTFIPLSSAEPQPKGVELGFACVYQLEPRPAPGAALLWDYSPVASEPGRHTLCQDRQEGAYLFSGRFEISVYVPESLLNHDQFRREFLRIGEDAGVAAPCRR